MSFPNEIGENSFTLTPTPSGWRAQSKFYMDAIGDGTTPESAVQSLNRALIYIQDNDPRRWQRIQALRIHAVRQHGGDRVETYRGRV